MAFAGIFFIPSSGHATLREEVIRSPMLSFSPSWAIEFKKVTSRGTYEDHPENEKGCMGEGR